MEAGWGTAFAERLGEAGDEAIATILTRDNREFFAHPGELEILPTFPTAWIIRRGDDGSSWVVIPESEIVRVEAVAAS